MDWSAYVGHEATIASALRAMLASGVTVSEALKSYDVHMARLMADMRPAPEEAPPAPDPASRRAEGQADTEFRLGPCPRCGAEVWGIRKCPHIAPPWRTFLACDSETCGYHGKSRLTVDELRRVWPVGVEED